MWSRMMGGFPFYYSVEAIMMVGGVLDSSDGTVRFDQGVRSMDGISISGLVLAVDVPGVWVMDGISVVVVGVMVWVVFFVLWGGVDGGVVRIVRGVG